MEHLIGEVMTFLRHVVDYKYFLPAVFVVGGFVVGFVIEVILIRRLARIVRKTHLRFDDFIIRAFRRMGILWFGLAGVYWAVDDLVENHVIKQKYVGPIDKVLLVIVIFSVTIVCARIVVGFISYYLKRMEYPSTTIFTNIGYVLILIVGSLIVLDALHISITPILTALGVGGLAAALALQETLSNFFAGIQIIAGKKIKPGDYVRLEGGGEGHITDITWRNTVIRTLANNVVIVPNGKLSSTIVTNMYGPSSDMAVIVPVGVAYSSNLELVERVTVEVARGVMQQVPGGVGDFQPVIRYTELSDSAVKFNVILRVSEYTQQYLIVHEFIKRLLARYQQEGIEIPFPTRRVFLTEGDGEKR
jgi:small-conductance mechanosensitive channel